MFTKVAELRTICLSHLLLTNEALMVSCIVQKMVTALLCCFLFTSTHCAEEDNEFVPVDLISGKLTYYGNLPSCVQKDCVKNEARYRYELKSTSIWNNDHAKNGLCDVLHKQYHVQNDKLVHAFVASLLIESNDVKYWYKNCVAHLNPEATIDEDHIGVLKAAVRNAFTFNRAVEAAIEKMAANHTS